MDELQVLCEIHCAKSATFDGGCHVKLCLVACNWLAVCHVLLTSFSSPPYEHVSYLSKRLTVMSKYFASYLQILQIPLDLPGEMTEVTCWEFQGTAFDQGDAAASWFTNYLGSPHRLVRYAGKSLTPESLLAANPCQMLRIVCCCWLASTTDADYMFGKSMTCPCVMHTGKASESSSESDTSRRPADPKYTTDQEVAFADGFPALIVSQVTALAPSCTCYVLRHQFGMY